MFAHLCIQMWIKKKVFIDSFFPWLNPVVYKLKLQECGKGIYREEEGLMQWESDKGGWKAE